MKTITMKQIQKLGPCYDPAKYGLETATLSEILEIEEIPIADRIWVVCQLLPATKRKIFAFGCAERAEKYAAYAAAGYAASAARYAAAVAARYAAAAAAAARYAADAARYAAAAEREKQLDHLKELCPVSDLNKVLSPAAEVMK